MTKLAVVTATRDRCDLLVRLHSSLMLQQDTSFVWLVVDDGSNDGTAETVSSLRRGSPFKIQLIRRETSAGKCACLNVAFNSIDADFYVVVDSDDCLNLTAVANIRRRFEALPENGQIGAIVFRYVHPDGSLIGPDSLGGEHVASRSAMDDRFGKFDGCVGYTRQAVTEFCYPVFSGENYIGPTVLQLLMADRYRILFTDITVGTAEYQPDGLSRSGRSLRLRNPRGMMTYSALYALQSMRLPNRMKHRIGFWAYAALADGDSAVDEVGTHSLIPTRWWHEVLLGRFVAARWRKRYLP